MLDNNLDNYNIIIRSTKHDIILNDILDFVQELNLIDIKAGDILYYSTSSEYGYFDLQVVEYQVPDFDKGYIILETI